MLANPRRARRDAARTKRKNTKKLMAWLQRASEEERHEYFMRLLVDRRGYSEDEARAEIARWDTKAERSARLSR